MLRETQQAKHMPQTDEQPAREGNADLIRGAGLFDTPDPGTGNVLAACAFPGNAALVVYPGCDTYFDVGGMVLSLDESGTPRLNARPAGAAIELKDGEIRFHPPASDPMLRAAARVCEQFGIDIRDPIALLRLVWALVTKHYPDTLLPAGRSLSSDERAMSIAWVVDQERQDDEPSPDAIRRARPKLLDYCLIDESISADTLERLFREGQSLLRRHGMEPWRRRAQGRPRKNSTPKQS
jgi:hypothetical protein